MFFHELSPFGPMLYFQYSLFRCVSWSIHGMKRMSHAMQLFIYAIQQTNWGNKLLNIWFPCNFPVESTGAVGQ